MHYREKRVEGIWGHHDTTEGVVGHDLKRIDQTPYAIKWTLHDQTHYHAQQ